MNLALTFRTKILTVGGFVFPRLSVSEPGDAIDFEGFAFVVESVEGRRVRSCSHLPLHKTVATTLQPRPHLTNRRLWPFMYIRRMDVSLEGKSLVTGASRGIGQAIAETMAASGAKVMLTSRKLDQLEAVKAEMEGDVDVIASHVGDADSVRKRWRRQSSVSVRLTFL